MKQYIKLYGPSNGLVCLALGLLFLTFNILLIEVEGITMRILMFAPTPLILTGLSLLLFPGEKITKKEIHDKNIPFWSTSPKLHKIMWVVFGLIWGVFLVLQLLSLFRIIPSLLTVVS